MDEARFNIAFGNILAEIDRRLFNLGHSLPTNRDMILEKLGIVARIIEHTSLAIVDMETGTGGLEKLENVQELISKERIYENEKAKAEGEKA